MRSYYVRRKEQTAFQLKNLLPSVKHGGGSVMVRASFAASWPGQPVIIDGTMNSELYQAANCNGKRQDICLSFESQENLGHAARQQPQAYKSFYQRMVKNKVNVLEWLSQRSDINPIEMLWKDISKQFIGGNLPTSQSLSGFALRNGLKLLHVIVQN